MKLTRRQVIAGAAAGVLGAGGVYELDESQLSEVQRKFPTGALATLRFDGEWRELRPGGARLEAFVRPKLLAAH